MLDAADEAVLFLANRTSEDLASQRVLSLAYEMYRNNRRSGVKANERNTGSTPKHPLVGHRGNAQSTGARLL
jgi:hypothetical protein